MVVLTCEISQIWTLWLEEVGRHYSEERNFQTDSKMHSKGLLYTTVTIVHSVLHYIFNVFESGWGWVLFTFLMSNSGVKK